MNDGTARKPESDLSLWAADLGLVCDNTGCNQPATHTVSLHPNTQNPHISQLRCIHCVNMLKFHTRNVISRFGFIYCGACHQKFGDVDKFVGMVAI